MTTSLLQSTEEERKVCTVEAATRSMEKEKVNSQGSDLSLFCPSTEAAETETLCQGASGTLMETPETSGWWRKLGTCLSEKVITVYRGFSEILPNGLISRHKPLAFWLKYNRFLLLELCRNGPLVFTPGFAGSLAPCCCPRTTALAWRWHKPCPEIRASELERTEWGGARQRASHGWEPRGPLSL